MSNKRWYQPASECRQPERTFRPTQIWNEYLRNKLDGADEARTRSDTIIMQLIQQLERTQFKRLERQIETKDQQINKLQQALAQEQQLHTVSQKTIESKQLKAEDMNRNCSILTRICEVFIPSNT